MTLTLVQPTGPAHTRIYAYGAARGEIAVPNDDLIGPIDSSDEWIRQRTGIITRTRAVAETTAIDLATDAASRGDRALRHRPAADRRRHRRDDQQPEADAVGLGHRRRPRRREPRRRLRRQRRLRRLLLRRRAGRRADPRRAGALRPRHRHREAQRHRRPDRPQHLVPPRRRRRRGRHRTRATRPASARPCGARTARRPTPSA